MSRNQTLSQFTAREIADLKASGKLDEVVAIYREHSDRRGACGLEVLTPTNGKPR